MNQSSSIERLHSYLPKLSLVHHSHLVDDQLIQEIHSLSNQDLCGGPISDHDMAQSVRAGFFLIAGAFEEAHSIVQELETLEAYYWHGIIHRREPDWSNAKYWFRRLGHHLVFDDLTKLVRDQSSQSQQSGQVLFPSGKWDAFKFVDFCQSSESEENSETLDNLIFFQQYELEMLLKHCLREALHKK